MFAVLHEAEVRQGAVSLALGVCGRLGKVMAEASLGVTVVMQYADGGGAYKGVRRAGVEGQW